MSNAQITILAKAIFIKKTQTNSPPWRVGRASLELGQVANSAKPGQTEISINY